MLTRDELAGACRINDERSLTGIEPLLLHLGVEPRGSIYVAEQRALRQALVYEGWSPSEIALMASGVKPSRIRLGATLVYMPGFSAMWLDGLAAARRATLLGH